MLDSSMPHTQKCYYINHYKDVDVVANNNQYIPHASSHSCASLGTAAIGAVQKALDRKNKSEKKQDQSSKIRKKKQETSKDDKSIQQFYNSLTHHYNQEGI